MYRICNMCNILVILVYLFGCNASGNGPGTTTQNQFLGSGNYAGKYWPTQSWRSCKPEEVGMDSDKLTRVYEYAANPAINTEGIIIIKNGYIVGEAYLNGFTKNSRHASYSVAKSFASALIGITIDKGLIKGVDEKIYQYYPQWQTPGTSEAKKTITIKNLLTMTAGLEWEEDDYYSSNSQDDIFQMYNVSNDFIDYVLNKPVKNEPSTQWYYSSGESILLSGIIESATNMTAYQFGFENLFRPIGIPDIRWDSDPSGHTITAWGINATVREFAKFGYLYLNKGKWQDQQIVSEAWIQESTQAISDSLNHYGYQWWLPAAYKDYEVWNILEGTFLAMGIYIQRLYVVPEKDLVVVRVGNDAGSTDGEWSTLEFLALVLNSIITE